MYDVIALGELLVDFTNNGTSDQGNMLFEANPGGAPCNVLAMLAKLGKKNSLYRKGWKRYVWCDAKGNDRTSGNFIKGTKSR